MAAFVQRVLTVAVCLVLPLPCVAVPGWHADTPATWRYRRRRCGGWWTVAGRRVMGVVRIVLLGRVRWRQLATAATILRWVACGKWAVAVVVGLRCLSGSGRGRVRG